MGGMEPNRNIAEVIMKGLRLSS